MKRILCAFFLLGGLMFSNTSSASIWSWIDTLTTCSGYAYCYDYQFTIADWDESDTAPNPCYGLNGCTLFISHRHNSSGTSGSGVVRSWGAGAYPFITTSETMGELAKEFKAIFALPFSATTNHSSPTAAATEECVGIFYAAGQNLGSYTSPTTNDSFRGYPLMPGSICGAAPAPSGSCDFDQDVLTLDHGTLSRSELEGHEVSENVTISCTTSQTLKLYIYSADNVQLRNDGSLYSELYMNDTVLGTKGFDLNVEQQENVMVKSVLRTNGSVEAGEFSGSTVMLITVE